MSGRSGRSAPATAATRCSARSASPCASPSHRPRRRAGWPSTCCSWASTSPAGREDLRRGRLPQRLRQDELRHAHSARNFAGLEDQTVGDDIVWMWVGDRRPAVRRSTPKRATSASCPGTNCETNPNAMATIDRGNTIFTNVGADRRRRRVVGRQDRGTAGRVHRLAAAKAGRRRRGRPAGGAPEQPLQRAADEQCPILAPEYDDPDGVPVRAIIFGGRRADDGAAGVPGAQLAARRVHGRHAGLARPPRPRPDTSGSCDATRWPCCLSSATTCDDYFAHWLRWAQSTEQACRPSST